LIMSQNDNKPNGLGIAAGVLGVLGAIGVAMAASGGSKKPSGLRGARPFKLKKPCGCGR
jgi:hypothetical protein